MRLPQALEEIRLFQRKFGLLLIDLDHFKSINDKYGHAGGDEVLQMVSRTTVASLRGGDVVGRWGGDEFLVLLEDADRQLTQALAQRCLMVIQDAKLRLRGEIVIPNATIGATSLCASDEANSAIGRADAALYRAKRNGRNQVSFEELDGRTFAFSNESSRRG
jgi:diguanylate cyclase (GGDEF)-like protein